LTVDGEEHENAKSAFGRRPAAFAPNIALAISTNVQLFGIYHFKGMRWYGNTNRGAYICKKEGMKRDIERRGTGNSHSFATAMVALGRLALAKRERVTALEPLGEGDLLARGAQVRRLLGGEVVGQVVGEAGEAGVGTVDRRAAAEQVVGDAGHVALIVGDAGDLAHRVIGVGGAEDHGATVVELVHGSDES
jgi:hypothetical protein